MRKVLNENELNGPDFPEIAELGLHVIRSGNGWAVQATSLERLLKNAPKVFNPGDEDQWSHKPTSRADGGFEGRLIGVKRSKDDTYQSLWAEFRTARDKGRPGLDLSEIVERAARLLDADERVGAK